MARTKAVARKEEKKKKKTLPNKKKKEPEIKARKPHRFRPGTVALREIRRFQKDTHCLIPKASIERVIREVLHSIKADCRITSEGVNALRESSEYFLSEVQRRTNALTLFKDTVTITPGAMRMALAISDDMRRFCLPAPATAPIKRKERHEEALVQNMLGHVLVQKPPREAPAKREPKPKKTKKVATVEEKKPEEAASDEQPQKQNEEEQRMVVEEDDDPPVVADDGPALISASA